MASAQSNQLKLWTFPPDFIQFNPSPLIPAQLPSNNAYAGQQSVYANNAMHDASGNLLFFIVDGIVYDKDGKHIGDIKNPNPGFNANETIEGITEWIIVPVPGECTKYYLIGGDFNQPKTNWGDPLPFYNVLDLNIPNTNTTQTLSPDVTATGDFLSQFATLISPTQGYDPHHGTMLMAASKIRTSGDRFLFVFDGSIIFRFKITNTGIAYDNDSENIITANASEISRSEMELVELSGGDYRMAFSFSETPPINKIFVGNYNSMGVLITQTIINAPSVSKVRGIEFSADGRYLYTAHTEPPYLQYVDLLFSSTLSPIKLIPSIGSTLLNPQDFQYSQIELGSDGRLYFAGNGGNPRLATLNTPSNPLTSTWSDNAVPGIDVPLSTAMYTSPQPEAFGVRILPDQIDGENYSANILVNSYTAGTAPNTAFNQTWTPTSNPFGGTSSNAVYTVNVLNNIIIPQGFNITIQGMTFKFNPRTVTGTPPSSITHYGAYVAVQDVLSATGSQVGGRLTLNNSVFTSSDLCAGPGMWEGVQVWGKPTLPQGNFTGSTAGKQGWFRMLNASKISNAYTGAYAGRNDFDGSHNPPLSGGGVIQAYSNSEFLNNQYGVYFTPYTNTAFPTINVSTFNNVKFTTNALLNAANVKPVAMAQLMDVSGVQFRTCIFKNYVPGTYPIATITSTNYGIFSYNSQFYCNPATVNTFGIGTGCTFENLKYGIYATYTNNAKTVTVDNCFFTNNYRGIYLSSATLTPTVTRNTFQITAYNASNANLRAYGLYLNACNGYKVDENDFTTMGGLTTVNNIGIIVNNSGAYRNLIYKNKFHQVFAGIQAQNNNCALVGIPPYDPVNDFGLQNRCNTFNAIKNMDMGITSGCIDFHQGVSLTPAANEFSHSNNNSYNDYFTYSTTNSNAFIGYFHNTDYVQTPQTGRFTAPPAIILAPNGSAYNSNTQCLSRLNGQHLTQLVSDIRSQIKTYQAKIEALTSLLNSGKDASLITAINSNMDAGNLKNLLISKSPYLSDDVLFEYINKNAVPYGHLKDVIVSNSPVTALVKSALDAISLPNGIRNLVNAAQTATQSERQIAIDLIKYYKFEISILKTDIVRSYVNSTFEIKIDTIISKIKEYEGIDIIENIKEKEILADLYIEKQDYATAEVLIASIETEPEKQNLAKLKRVNKELKQNNLSIYALQADLVNKQIVEHIATDNTIQGYELAVNIMQHVFNEAYLEPIDELTHPLHHYISIESNKAIANEPTIVCYPNPAYESISFNYNLQDDFVSGNIEIYNALGQKIKYIDIDISTMTSTLNITELPDGLYFYTLVVNKTTIAKDKFVISK